MKDQDLEKLELAINQFYLNTDLDKPTISDEEYDALAKEYESSTGKSVKELIKFEERTIPLKYFSSIPKTQTYNLIESVEKYINGLSDNKYIINFKYDGSSVCAIYSEGYLKYITGTADEASGIDRTQSLWEFFPKKIHNKDIVAIRGEILVDANKYGELARNKANGLVNSKYMEKEILEDAYLRVYNIAYKDGNYDFNRLSFDLNCLIPIFEELPINYNNESADRSNIAVGLTSPSKLDKTIVTEWFTDKISIQIDGAVIYSENGIRAFKFYFTESAITKVRKINYNLQTNGSYAPVLEIEPITLNGKRICNVSANGIPFLIEKGMGIGAEIEVILANLTIPKVHKVYKPSTQFNFPVCKCGYRLTEKDLYGSFIKCSNTSCSFKEGRVEKYFDKYKDIGFGEYLNDHTKVFHMLGALYIDRWDPKKQFKFNINDSHDIIRCGSDIYASVITKNIVAFSKTIKSNFRFSDLSLSLLNINIFSLFKYLTKWYDNSQDVF